MSSSTETQPAAHGYPLCSPYVWPYTPAALNRLLPDTETTA